MKKLLSLFLAFVIALGLLPTGAFAADSVEAALGEVNIYNGDYVVIDKSLEANDGDYIAAYIDGEFTLKQLKRDAESNCVWLIPHNPAFEPIKVTEENNFMVWGVVTNIIRRLRK